jgi:hypothetical protein
MPRISADAAAGAVRLPPKAERIEKFDTIDLNSYA